MADVIDRDKHEEHLARMVSRLFGGLRRDVSKGLGDAPKMADVSPEVWREFGENFMDAVAPLLVGIYVRQAKAMQDEVKRNVARA